MGTASEAQISLFVREAVFRTEGKRRARNASRLPAWVAGERPRDKHFAEEGAMRDRKIILTGGAG